MLWTAKADPYLRQERAASWTVSWMRTGPRSSIPPSPERKWSLWLRERRLQR